MNLLERATAIGVKGFMHPSELEKLADLACGKRVLEVGSFMGLSAWAMASVAHSVTCVDTFRANSAGQFQMETITTLPDFLKATERFRHVGYHAKTSEHAERHIGSTQWSMIFLDAMHTYEDVKADIERWWPHLESGGIFAFHDYGHSDFPGVKKAVDERFGEQKDTIITLMWMTKP